DAHYDIKNENLAQVNTKYFAQQPNDKYVRIQHTWRPYENVSYGLAKDLDVPQERMEYFVADDTNYKNEVSGRGGFLLQNSKTTFEREFFDRTWFKQVLQPGLGGTSPIQRDGGFLKVLLYEYTDANNNWSFGISDSNPTLRVFENGEFVNEVNRLSGAFQLISEESEVRLEVETNSGKAFSSHTLTNWTFTSVEPEEDEQEIVPLLLIDYHLNLSLLNAALRPSETEKGNDDIFFEVSHQPG